MRLAIVGLFSMAMMIAGCGGEDPKPKKTTLPNNVDLSSTIAGKTYRCTAEGPASQMTFAADGKITGILLNAPATGSWFSRGAEGVEVHVSTGVIAIRDVLKRRGGSWAGRNLRCS
ncbi:MAG: hypothetical protein AAF557_07000 [Pseudomonadota bacterium]